MREAKDGHFLVKFLYRTLDQLMASVFLFRSVWNLSVPTWVGIFVQEASWAKVLTVN